jgi:hypothetical protein
VRFADEIEEIPEESLNVSDELIEMYEEESAPKRCRAGLAVKLIDSVSIPGDSMMFVAAKIPRKFTGNGAVKLNRNRLLAVIKRRWRCFPNKDGQIGQTDQAEHLIDTGDAQPV